MTAGGLDTGQWAAELAELARTAPRIAALFGEFARRKRETPDGRPLPLAERIANKLMAEIRRGIFEPGGPIREQDLADRFGVSRGPVREALRILERNHLIEILPWCGARVTAFSRDAIIQVTELRAVVFGYIAGSVARDASEDQVREMEAMLVELEALAPGPQRPEGYPVFAIGLYMAQICTNPWARELNEQLGRQAPLFYGFFTTSTEAQRRRSVAAWRSMLESIRAGDADTAESIAKRMVRQWLALALEARDAAAGAEKGLDPAAQ